MSGAIKCVLFDMDGVLAAVGNSYRDAIIATAAIFGVSVTQEDITTEKKKGNANNDWVLTKRLIETKNPALTPSLEDVTEEFEKLYQGTATTRGLCETETLIPSRGFLIEIARRCDGKVAIVTGRPRKDCYKFLDTHKLRDLYPVCICMEDVVKPKPDPSGVLMACKMLGMDPSDCLMIGDTPDDIKAGKAAGTYAWGVLTPEEEAKVTLGLATVSDTMSPSLLAAQADGVMPVGLSQMLDLIPPPSPPNGMGIVGTASGGSSSSTASMAQLPLLLPQPPSITTPLKNTAATATATAVGGASSSMGGSSSRVGAVERVTKETKISVAVCLDGSGRSSISTGLGFLDHMFSQLAKHGRFDISLNCAGDLYIDDHHTAEDCALALGEAFDKALGPRAGITRFGMAHCPLDEALSRVVVDISSRPHAVIDLQFTREKIGDISCEMLQHVLESFASTCRMTLHVTNIYGYNNHHKAESAFKALGVAMRQAVSADATAGVPSTKGVLA
mmetsp:Transcript_12405/g.20649  ORF Transcript_12405/g.20649 Transcript_12405/m.20649 type:complete len:503 (+) Transcript_12405:54-1562(+)|eukprot:CAMPEP_0175025142 /NCGR_PEP_ID=MMETSP0005-20121125/16916_1 /TAXON_ID=420556 /ORGANISM="Ochromonas sp., Strain CCMP1393" /LENGTH=502 /DNA_ID=CAMNT_0016283889 /DNA_START=51 /DNA_END=1559 /DNA_ORIENTATION=+